MNPDEFTASLETALRNRHVEFSRADLIIWTGSCWPLSLDHPNPPFWADRFCEGADLMAPA